MQVGPFQVHFIISRQTFVEDTFTSFSNGATFLRTPNKFKKLLLKILRWHLNYKKEFFEFQENINFRYDLLNQT